MCLGAHQTQVHDVLGVVHVEPIQCLKKGTFVLAKSAKYITANSCCIHAQCWTRDLLSAPGVTLHTQLLLVSPGFESSTCSYHDVFALPIQCYTPFVLSSA